MKATVVCCFRWRYRERFADVGLYENDPYPGIHDTLQQLHSSGVQLYVASSKPLVYVEQILQRFDLMRFFSTAFGSELDGTRTDKSDLLAYALQRSGEQAAHSTMIGDRKHDAIGAHNNGLQFIGVLYGYGGVEEFASVGAHRMVDAHHELPAALDG